VTKYEFELQLMLLGFHESGRGTFWLDTQWVRGKEIIEYGDSNAQYVKQEFRVFYEAPAKTQALINHRKAERGQSTLTQFATYEACIQLLTEQLEVENIPTGLLPSAAPVN